MTLSTSVVSMREAHIPGVMSLVRTHLELISYPFDMTGQILDARVRRSLHDAGGLRASDRRYTHWVCLSGNQVVGALQAYAPTSPPPPNDPFPGNIGWLIFDPSTPAAGHALLQRTRSWLGADWSKAEAFALANCIGWVGGMPSAWTHVRTLLLQYDFVHQGANYLMCGEVPADWCIDYGPSPYPVDIQESKTSHGRKFRAVRSGEKIGELSIIPMDRTNWVPSWERGWWIDWVEVEEVYRGKGIAKQLFGAMADCLRREGFSRIAGHTDSPQAVTLNKWVGMQRCIPVEDFRRMR